jgi:hypothetical protein
VFCVCFLFFFVSCAHVLWESGKKTFSLPFSFPMKAICNVIKIDSLQYSLVGSGQNFVFLDFVSAMVGLTTKMLPAISQVLCPTTSEKLTSQIKTRISRLGGITFNQGVLISFKSRVQVSNGGYQLVSTSTTHTHTHTHTHTNVRF